MNKKTVAVRRIVVNTHPNPFLCYWPKYNVVLDLSKFAKHHTGGAATVHSALRNTRDITAMFQGPTSHSNLSEGEIIEALTPYVTEGQLPKPKGCCIS